MQAISLSHLSPSFQFRSHCQCQHVQLPNSMVAFAKCLFPITLSFCLALQMVHRVGLYLGLMCAAGSARGRAEAGRGVLL